VERIQRATVVPPSTGSPAFADDDSGGYADDDSVEIVYEGGHITS
jgi:hypothetical protein